MSPSYQITEPHPTVPATQYLHTGRGGAGNVTRAPSNTTSGASATGPASHSSHLSVTSSTSSLAFHSGRGGLGNIHPGADRAIFSFDEELERQRRILEHQAPLYHVGRGGAGNFAAAADVAAARRSSAAESELASSQGSRAGSLEGAWNRFRTSLQK